MNTYYRKMPKYRDVSRQPQPADIKVGDRVVVRDGSAALTQRGDGFVHETIAYAPAATHVKSAVVIAIDCVLPRYHESLIDQPNDTIIKASDGRIILTQARFLRKC